jgi:phosphoribosyl 1,2-cyclic phosphate phosphodiesterase
MYLSPTLQITFLGTGTSSGVPMIACNCEVCTSSNKKDKRLRSSILLKYNNTTLVIDTTPDFRYQMLRENVQNLDAVLFTHPHKDHIAGLDDVKAFNYFSKKPIQVYANEFTQHELKREFYYVFAEHKYPGIPEIDLVNIEADSFEIDELQITPIKVWHLNMPVLGFRFGDFTYITDANRIDDAEKEKIKGSKVLVLNALRHTEHISHFTLQQAIDLGKELQIPQVYFTHISHQLGLHDIVTSTLEKGFALAYDGLTIEV